MRVFRRADVHEGARDGLWGDEMPDVGLGEALQIGVVMMMEDDGKNGRQMLLWARADVFVKRLLRRRLYAGAEANDGWPLDDEVNTRYCGYLRVKPHSHPPLTPRHTGLTQSTRPPALSSPCTTARRTMGRPPAALAAILSFHARAEVHARAIPPHLARTREDIPDHVAPTREDVEEVAWAWVARPPLGAGLRARDGERVLVEEWQGREHSSADSDDEGQAFPERPKGIAHLSPHAPIERWVGKAPHSPLPKAGKSLRWDADWARLRMCGDMWVRLAQGTAFGCGWGYVHTPGSLDGLWSGVMQLSADSVLQQLVGDASHPVHGSFTEEVVGGANQPVSVWLREVRRVGGGNGGGRCCCSSHGAVWQDDELDDSDEGEDEEGVDDSSTDDESDDEQEQEQEETADDYFVLACDAAGVNNAWFAGEGPPVFVPLSSTTTTTTSKRPVFPPHHATSLPSPSDEDATNATQYQVHAEDGSARGTFRTHAYSSYSHSLKPGSLARTEAQRLGNDAECPEWDSELDFSADEDDGCEAEEDSDAESPLCEACAEKELDRERMKTSTRSRWKAHDKRARESLFTSVGLSPSSPSHSHQTHTHETQTQDILLHGHTPHAPARA
ncbi:hypothetical protein H0H81_009616 [Sphagnurus paluster]|uniref:Uncharacterized protein n=1 Tax=Sphagnurus paluster TaxID=117069 RepID=A0A9P7GJG1_9AGAR|nr:hypothetical protein H0H81_009616 [Sphagnurus paluster]